MPVTRQQAVANARTATRVLARQLGFYANTGAGFDYGALTPEQQTTLTNALARYVADNPTLFDTGEPGLANPVNAAPHAANNLAPVGDVGFAGTVDQFADAFLAAGQTVNPLSTVNVGTVGRWLFFGAIALGGLWLLLNNWPPRGPRHA